MPRLIDTGSRAATLTAAVNDAIAEHGPAGLTMRRIARLSGVSQASIAHHLGNREHLLRVAAFRTANERHSRQTERAEKDLVDALVPFYGEDVLDARCWLGWQELARSEETLERVFDEARRSELAVIAKATGYRLQRDDLEAVSALAAGLAVALCQPRQPMRTADARRIMRRHLARIDPDDPAPDARDVTPWRPHVSWW